MLYAILIHMSDQTKKDLDDAEALLAGVLQIAGDQARSCGGLITSRLPERLDALTKDITYEEPDVTRALGKENFDALRRALATIVEKAADSLPEAMRATQWPNMKPNSGAFLLDGAMADVLLSLCQAVSRVFRNAGYWHVASAKAIRPSGLYTHEDLAALVPALQRVTQAREHVKDAKAADDRSAVDELWS